MYKKSVDKWGQEIYEIGNDVLVDLILVDGGEIRWEKNLNLPAAIPATPMDEPVNLVAIVPEDIYDDISDMNKLDNIYNYCEKKRIDIELLYTTDIENPADSPMFSSYNRERNSYLKAFKEGLCFDKDQYGFSKPAIEKYKEVTKALE